ncbi:DUF4328 domain-containing protein [Streptomyces sp. NPDC021212]|uniref:DUF4328 domain-containing protein n=1 Tax=Streptomyces sp. NPDC021212 TaxID=3365118 RepID=UPI0037ABCF8B
MYPCGNCRAVAVGPDGRCAACGTYQQQLRQQPAPTTGPGAYGYPAAPPVSMPAAGAMPAGGVDLRRGMSTALQVLFGATIAVLILAFIARVQQYNLYGDVLDGGSVSPEKADDADEFYRVALLLSSAVMLALGIVWPIWFRRLRLNAEVFAPGQHRFSPGWAAGAWFTPVVSLWFPKQIANDIWRASSPQGPHQAGRGLLNGWWVCWVISGPLFSSSLLQWSNARQRALDSGLFGARGAIEDMRTAIGTNCFAYLVTLAAAILGLMVVRQITTMQEQRAALPQGPQGHMPPQAPMAPGAPGNPYGGGAPGNPYGGGAPQMPPVVPQAPPAPPSAPPAGPRPPYGQG